MFQVEHVTFFIVGLLVYIGLMVAIGYYFSRGKYAGRNFFTGGAKLPFFLIFATIAATLIGTGSAIGATANGFRIGWGGSAFGLGAAIGLILMMFLVRKTTPRSKGFLTMAEEAQYLFKGSVAIKNVTGVMMFVISVVWLGNHINGGGTLLAFVTGLDPITARFITTLGFAAYVMIAGYLAVVYTDTIQICLLVGGFIIIVLTAIPAAGGWAEITSTIEAAGRGGNLTFYGVGTTGWMSFIALVFAVGFPIIATPTYRMRIYTSANDKIAEKSFLTSAALMLGFSLFPALIGMAAFTMATNNNVTGVLENPDFAFAFVATQILGPILGLFFLIVGLTASMSSGDSDAIAGTTILLQDVYPSITGKYLPDNKVVFWSRIAVLFTLACAFISTLGAQDIMAFIRNVVGAVVPGVSVAMLLGALWKRVTWQGGLAAILSGTGFGVAFLSVPAVGAWVRATFTAPAIPAAIIALVFGLVFSFCTECKPMSHEDRMAAVIASRGARQE